MAKKCKICGYRFKSNDEVICPECFTAREEDISCGSYSSDLHDSSHGSDMSRVVENTRKSDVFEEYEKHESFIEEQRADEAVNPIPDSTYNKSETSARQQKLDALRNAPSNGDGISSPYNNGKSTLNWTTSVSPSSAGQNFQRDFVARQKKNSKGCVIGIIIFVTLWFVIPFISGIMAVIGSKSSDSYEYDHDEFEYSFEKPDISFADIEVPDLDGYYSQSYTGTASGFEITVDNMVKYDSYSGLEKAPELSAYSYTVVLVDNEYIDADWRFIEFDMEFIPDIADDERYADVDRMTVTAYDAMGNNIAESEIIGSTVVDEKNWESCRFMVPSDAFAYSVNIPTSSDEYGDETAMVKIYSYEFRSELTETDDNNE